MRTSSLRIAILTSLGLLPLGCFAGSARGDVDDDEITSGAGSENSDEPDSTGEQEPAPSAEQPDDPPRAPVAAPACGASVVVTHEEIEQKVIGYSPPVTPGTETGIYRCESGLLHRPEAVACRSGLPRPLPPESTSVSQVEYLYSQAGRSSACSADADCTARANGYCAPAYQGDMGGYHVVCKYGCLADADCGEGFLCECGDPVGRCVPAQCRSDQDCGGDLKCGLWQTQFICSVEQSYTCQTPADTCNTTADCGERQYCSGEGGTRSCVGNRGLVCGRPFLVEGEQRMAELCASADWASHTGAALGSVEALGTSQRATVAEHWARAGLMEHASIAAFARFTLQLLHLGAPRELIEQSQRAMLDETEHAKACFGLASRYLAQPLAPGRLPMDAALADNELEAVTLMTFLEGCVGETVATLEAQAALQGARDEDVCRALTRIAADELRHAALAWRFVRWALPLGGASLERALASQLAQLAAELRDPAPVVDVSPLAAHGVLSRGCRAHVRRAAIAEVVLPCARALLGAHSGLKMPSRAACQITATEG
jgi:Cys-rich repeat protein